MALLLCIDTATEYASVCVGNNNEILASLYNTDQKNHAAFLQPAIQNLIKQAAVSVAEIDAVAVVNGPGSYTGLRVGLSSAKGICYAAGKPLILLNTLAVMASAAIDEVGDKAALYCPVIDARRNEVFAAIYNYSLHIIMSPQPVIIQAESFNNYSNEQKMIFFGSGHNKCEKLIMRRNNVYANLRYSVSQVNKLAQQCFFLKHFSSIAYAEPFYTKEFFLRQT